MKRNHSTGRGEPGHFLALSASPARCALSARRVTLAGCTFLAGLALLVSGCADQGPQVDGADVFAAAAVITPEDYAERVGVLAADSMRGRFTPSPELEKAARWIAAEFRAMGLRGGAEDGAFIQRYPLPRGEGQAPNVVAVLEGSDPELKREYVVFMAHMDHVGVRAPDEHGDSIFNGADDNASGTAAVMEVARAAAAMNPRPRRSFLFLLVSGEERGLWGSAYYTEHPTVPLDSMVAVINADMVGRNWSDSIVVIGKEHSDLGGTMERVAAEHPELNMAALDDRWPEENFYRRSDHFNFARKGVPVLFFFNGTHEDYHRPGDEPSLIDAEKASRIARLMFYLGVEIANAEEQPQWNPESYRQIVERADSGGDD
ncbi:MAG: M20/M25/M40 family metallo-hydrolase [Gemmatimonadota bacterium]